MGGCDGRAGGSVLAQRTRRQAAAPALRRAHAAVRSASNPCLHAAAPQVTDAGWDQQRMEEEGRQRHEVQEAVRRRNWGTPNLIG